MNIQELDILNILADEPFGSQRLLAERSGHSLGVVNRCLRSLAAEGYIDDAMQPTAKARTLFDQRRPKNAVILAAGTGMRMIPINTETPKGLLEVRGETLIERLIRQLQEVGIREIYVVVGFMKESYEYLIDKYGVQLVVNRDYAFKNNLHSLLRVIDRVSNTYVLPCDIWCARNPFSSRELYSWYMVTDAPADASTLRVNRKMELVTVPPASGGNAIIGISYLLEEQAVPVREQIKAMSRDPRHDGAFWDDTVYDGDRMTLAARVWPAADAVEINTYEQLRELDSNSSQLHADAIVTAARVLHAAPEEIIDVEPMKKGITNRSFLFTCRGKRYIMRIPGEASYQSIDRQAEALVYDLILKRKLCDNVIFIDPGTGYKITEYLPDTRNADPLDPEDIRVCMAKVRSLHALGLKVPHSYDIFGLMEHFEALWDGAPSAYRDYAETKEKVVSLRPFMETHALEPVLCHLDPNPDNFLFAPQPDGTEKLYLIDWEYAAMHDPRLDIAFFCTYCDYTREQVDQVIDAYYTEGCSPVDRAMVYCLISTGALQTSNWCEYERGRGVDFGEYSLKQYRYARELMEEMDLK